MISDTPTWIQILLLVYSVVCFILTAIVLAQSEEKKIDLNWAGAILVLFGVFQFIIVMIIVTSYFAHNYLH